MNKKYSDTGKVKVSRTSIKLIERSILEGWIKYLAFYYLLKAQFINSCIYNYKGRMHELTDKFNISTKTFYTYLSVLKTKDLAYELNNNLILRSERQYSSSRKKTIIYLGKGFSLFDITCLLYGKIIEQKAKQQAFMESLRRFRRGDRFKSRLCECPFSPSMSYRTIGKLLNMSENKAHKVIKNLNKLGVIKSENQSPRLISKGERFIGCDTEDTLGHRFTLGERLYELFGCHHTFIQFPVSLKRISVRQYKEYHKIRRS